MPQQKDIVKIAIQMPGAYPQLIQLDQKKPLSAVIKEVCDGWTLPGPENYALQYADGVQMYITESNRLDIKNGCILRLTKAPGRCAEDLYKGIQSSDAGVLCDSLKELAGVSKDVTFAQEFISRDGYLLLVKIVEDSNESNLIMMHTLTAFMQLMDHGIVSWENLSSVFIKKIANFVNAKATDESIQQVSLDILENMVLSSHSLFLQVKLEVTMERLIAHLQVTNQQIQTKAMALLMALLQTAGDADRQEMFVFLNKKNLRQYIYKNIILSSGLVQDEMAHYLYVLQSVTLNSLEVRMRMPLDCYSQEQRDILHALRQAAFETDSENSLSHERRRSLCAKEFKKLGFSVMQVVREQITRTLSSKPTSLELFKNKVNALNYGEILKLRQTERLHQEETLAPPVLELKERLKPELLELIRQQRLNRLCQGTMFRKVSSRRRQDKLWYCRLSPNHKMLHFGDIEEDAENPPIETLQDKIPVSDIKGLLTGKDCPHMKENKGKQNKEVLDLAFSITYDVEEYSLNFVAPSRTDFCLWTDGLSVLLGREMSSESMRSELEILLSMEIKLRLLDLENISIPDNAPAIPKPPTNYNFCYDFSHNEQ
ncbi:transcript variant X3 [Nothobranchius furzeri]|uniref:Transcript variant X3 n=1 Tax=Nothobranchius furzeri TaxID=105023 RepID=A0A9D2YSD2_NOTFU|nr:transcript variant X3 [Nothobranchius furzeri]